MVGTRARGPHKKRRARAIHDLLNIAESNAEAAVERASILDNLVERNLSPTEISNNPYSKLRATSSRLSAALKLLWVNESAMEKFLTLWRIFQKRV
jgi:Trp operon repressor